MYYGNDHFVKVIISLKNWDNQFTFYVPSQNIPDATEKAWKTFKEQRLYGVYPIEDWCIKETTLFPFETNTIFLE